MCSSPAYSKTVEREFILECIRVYRDLPCLWKVKSEGYSHREKKNKAYDILVKKYQERYPEADRKTVKKKFNSLRTNFRKELKKLGDSPAPHQSSSWYFSEMLFLINRNVATEAGSSVDMKDEIKQEEIWISDEDDHSTTHDQELQLQIPKKKTSKNCAVNLCKDIPRKRLHENDTTSECMQVAMVWASELQKMKPSQQIYAKKFINEIMFEGQLGTLHRYSVKINESQMSELSTT